MAYIKQEFQAGEILTAEALNAMDEQVYQNSQINELTEEKIVSTLGYTPADKDTVDTQTSEIDNLKTSVEGNTSEIDTLKTSVEKNTTDIDELNTNRLKVKTKLYGIEVAFDSNIGKYEGHINNSDFLKDFPSGTVIATLVTGHNSFGYGTLNGTWGTYDNNLIVNATMSGTYYATVTWLYL